MATKEKLQEAINIIDEHRHELEPNIYGPTEEGFRCSVGWMAGDDIHSFGVGRRVGRVFGFSTREILDIFDVNYKDGTSEERADKVIKLLKSWMEG